MTALSNFKNNIYNRSSYLRRRLGYLEPSLLKIYTYSSSNDKFKLRVMLESLIVYLCIVLGEIFRNISSFLIYIIILLILVILIELLLKFCMFIYYRIRK